MWRRWEAMPATPTPTARAQGSIWDSRRGGLCEVGWRDRSNGPLTWRPPLAAPQGRMGMSPRRTEAPRRTVTVHTKAAPRPVAEVLVLCYHAVSESWDASESVTPDALEWQLNHLRRRGWRAATFRDAILDPPAARTMAITFDDAFTSVKELAFPIVSKLGLTATVLAPTAYVGSGERCAWAGLDGWTSTPHANELAPMGWEELGELADSSWEIGSHTCTHPYLTKLDDADLARELEEPRAEAVKRL